jgi:hypothetical protein
MRRYEPGYWIVDGLCKLCLLFQKEPAEKHLHLRPFSATGHSLCCFQIFLAFACCLVQSKNANFVAIHAFVSSVLICDTYGTIHPFAETILK